MSKRILKIGWIVPLLLLSVAISLSCTSLSDLKLCINGISKTSIDTNARVCNDDCDCNNQTHTGRCIDGMCQSKAREDCKVKGRKKKCVLDIPVDKCTDGVQICQDEGLEIKVLGDCKLVEHVAQEVGGNRCSDLIDNDCDGDIDGADSDCNCPVVGKTIECGSNVGECKKGQRICGADNTWGSCIGEVENANAQCDGKDRDCNGSPDYEDKQRCVCKVGATRTCGQAKGLCKQGQQTCVAYLDCPNGEDKCITKSKWSLCIGEIAPQPRKCDGRDNDCDGQIDSNDKALCDCSPPGRIEPCYTGKPDTSVGKGICSRGTQICLTGGKWSQCLGQITPVREECNLKDDDCDGIVDNNKNQGTNSLTRKCYLAKTGCTLSNGTFQCNLPCKAGIQSCLNGNWTTCQGAIQPKTEVCNLKDDDCDGQVDNIAMNRTPLCDIQIGGCQGARLPPSACHRGKWRRCNVLDYQKTAAPSNRFNLVETCDNKDNNCNGIIDENLLKCGTRVAGCGRAFFKDGMSTQACFSHSITSLKFDQDGTLYIVDQDNHSIRKLGLDGIVSTVAGDGSSGQQDGPAQQARFHLPLHLAIDKQGNIFVTDKNNHTIRKIDNQGNVTTIAGSGTKGYKDGPGRLAEFSYPEFITLDPQGNLYVVDDLRIRKIDTKGNVSTFAGNNRLGYKDGPGKQAQFNGPKEITSDAQGNLYLADMGNHRIRKIDPKGNVSTYAGSGGKGSQDGPSGKALFTSPYSIAFDRNNNLYVAEDQSGDTKIRKIDSKGNVTTVASSLKALLSFTPEITSIALGPQNEIYFASRSGIWQLPPDKIRSYPNPWWVTSFAGSKKLGIGNGSRLSAEFNEPHGIVTHQGNLYVTDTANNVVRKIDPQGNVTTFAGTGTQGFANGFRTKALFNKPVGIAVDAKGNLYVADSDNYVIRKIDLQGNVTNLAGDVGKSGYKDGPGKQAQFKRPIGLAVDSKGNLYVVDWNNVVRRIDSQGNVSTFAGSGKQGHKDGPGTQAQFSGPSGLTIDAQDNLYIAELSNYRIRKIDPQGNVTTFAGSGQSGYKDGPPKSAQITPRHITIDDKNNLYVSDGLRIRKIDSKGNVTTIAGGQHSGFRNGIGINALFNSPRGLAFDAKGNLYVVEQFNHGVRKLFIRGVVDDRRSDRNVGESCDIANPLNIGHHKCVKGLLCRNNICSP